MLQEDKSGAWQRVWLRSRAKVAADLGVERIGARPVAVPLSVLLGPIGDVRVHFYASFHSSRGDVTSPGACPIAIVARVVTVACRRGDGAAYAANWQACARVRARGTAGWRRGAISRTLGRRHERWETVVIVTGRCAVPGIWYDG